MAQAYDQRRRVTVRGAGTKRGWAAPGEPADLVIDTGRLADVVEHAAGDLVVTAQAGVALQALNHHVGQAGQWLALDPPEVGASIGGIVATGASGPRRLLYGTPRDLLIGITVVLADGTVARSGGKVVKNVAGYDLGKLFTGSFGTLGVIAECTFRLHPCAPARAVVVSAPASPGEAVRRVRRSGVVPSAMEWDGTSLTTVIESTEDSAAQQAAEVTAAIGGRIQEELPPGFGARPWPEHAIGLKLTHRLGGLDPVLVEVARLLPAPEVRAHAASGVTWVGYDGDASEVEEVRRAVAAYDGEVVVVHAPADVKRTLDVWGPARGIDVMRRIKERFDPERLLAPGSFVGGL
jgi:glycolate oxidase FAD binding subunit